MYEHETNLSETKAEHMVALKISQDNHNEEEKQLIKDKSDLRKIQKNQELSCINEIRDIKLVSEILINYFYFTKSTLLIYIEKCRGNKYTDEKIPMRSYGIGKEI